MITDQDPDVAEGIKKLPKEEYLLRLERLRRAHDLSMKHRILPRHMWTKPEEVRIKDRILLLLSDFANDCRILVIFHHTLKKPVRRD